MAINNNSENEPKLRKKDENHFSPKLFTLSFSLECNDEGEKTVLRYLKHFIEDQDWAINHFRLYSRYESIQED